MRTIFYYKCDFGINPSHHHPKTCELILDSEHPDRVQIDYTGMSIIGKSTDDLIPAAEEQLKKWYGYVECTGVKVENFKSMNVVIQNDQTYW